MEALNVLQITYPCHVHDRDCQAGDVIEVDDETAYDLLNLGRAEIGDEATRTRWKQRPMRSTWSDPKEQAERKQVLHVVGRAA